MESRLEGRGRVWGAAGLRFSRSKVSLPKSRKCRSVPVRDRDAASYRILRGGVGCEHRTVVSIRELNTKQRLVRGCQCGLSGFSVCLMLFVLRS